MKEKMLEKGNDVAALVRQIHQKPDKMVYVAAGAGTMALNALLGVAGASRTLLEGLIPYSKGSFVRFLGRTPSKYVSKEVSQLLAGRALTRAQLLTDRDVPLVGVACTATIVTDRIKRGEHRAYIAVWRIEGLKSYYLQLDKGKRSREEEEAFVSKLLLNATAEAMGVDYRLVRTPLAGDLLTVEHDDYALAAEKVYSQHVPYFGIHAFGRIRYQDASPQVLLCGSFNPLHKGHLKLAEAASTHLNKPVAFELSAFNVDKPPLDKEDALYRLSQFAGHYGVYMTNAPTFLEKARVFGKTTFVVGYDTAVRILMPKYYDGSIEEMRRSLQEIQELGCIFLVAARIDGNGEIKTAEDLLVSAEFASLFQKLPKFRADISSTELRKKGNKGSR